MQMVRSIGRWSMTALVVNIIIGAGIFGIPSELNRVLGRVSPIAMIIAGLGMGLMMACFAEVASQFTEPGGAYLYARTAFGRFAGIQVGWFSWLAPIGASAASANLFINYLAGIFPSSGSGFGKATVLTALFGVLAVANYLGVRSGTGLSNLFTAAKLLPLVLLIFLGLVHFRSHPEIIAVQEVASPGWSGWFEALLLLAFAYAGYENTMFPMGEVKDPRRTVPVALAAGLFICIAVYALLQFVVVVTIGTGYVERPLALTAARLIGPAGAAFVTVAAMTSTYGNIAVMFLATPRLTYSLASRGDLPQFLGKVHPRFKTPYVSILFFGALTWILAVSGTFRWALAFASGAVIIIYVSVCASLIRLRKLNPNADALRVPFGRTIAAFGIVVAVVLMSHLSLKEGYLLGVAAILATLNWLWAKQNPSCNADASVD
jgi:APA family basic amino acid/polyamine antiporter